MRAQAATPLTVLTSPVVAAIFGFQQLAAEEQQSAQDDPWMQEFGHLLQEEGRRGGTIARHSHIAERMAGGGSH